MLYRSFQTKKFSTKKFSKLKISKGWYPTLVMRTTKKQSTCFSVASGSFWSTTSNSLKGCWPATNRTVLWLLPTPPLRTSKSLCKEQPTWPSPVNNPKARLHREETDRQFMERKKKQQKHQSIRCSKSQYINNDDSKKMKWRKLSPLNFKSYRRNKDKILSASRDKFYVNK